MKKKWCADDGSLTFSPITICEFSKQGDGNSNSLRKFSYSNASSSKKCKGTKDYLIFVITLAPGPIKLKKWTLWLLWIFVDDGPLTPLLIKLCDNLK